MNYQRIYNEFIADRRAKEPEIYRGLSYYGRITKEKRARADGQSIPYSEHHHIQASFEGGGNEADNIVTLSYRDHVFAHLCLAKAHGGRHYAALWSVVGMYNTPQMLRTIPAAIRHTKLNTKIRAEMASFQRGANNRRANLTIYEWWNVKTGECVTANRHEAPVSASQVKDYLAKNRKWPVIFAGGEWYILGLRFHTHEEARKNFASRNKRNSERQRGKITGRNHHSTRGVRCIETGEIFETQKIAGAAVGANQGKISECCRGTRNTAGGYHWEYAS